MRERWIVAVAALAAVLGTARLGWWQLDRAAQKEALQAQIETRRGLPELALTGWPPMAIDDLVQRPARARGRWIGSATIYLDNRQMGGRPGFYVVTPLRLADGSVLVVQRGWLPRDPQERTRVASPALPEGEVEVVGRLAPPPARLLEFDAASQGAIRQNLDLDQLQRELRLPVLPLSMLQTGSAAADGLQREWPEPASGVHKHYGYAFQWFALATLIVVLYVWFQLIRPRRTRRSDG